MFPFGKKDARRTPCNLNTQKILNWAKILDLKTVVEIFLELKTGCRIVAARTISSTYTSRDRKIPFFE